MKKTQSIDDLLDAFVKDEKNKKVQEVMRFYLLCGDAAMKEKVLNCIGFTDKPIAKNIRNYFYRLDHVHLLNRAFEDMQDVAARNGYYSGQ